MIIFKKILIIFMLFFSTFFFNLYNIFAVDLVDPTVTDTTVTDPTTTDPTATDATATDPTATDATATDPTATDSSVTDPTVTDPVESTDSTTDTTISDASDGGVLIDYSATNTTTTSSDPCVPLLVGTIYINPTTGKAVDEHCNEITVVEEVIEEETVEEVIEEETVVEETNTSVIESTQNYTDSSIQTTSSTSTTTSEDINEESDTMLESATGWDEIEEKPEGVVSVNGLNPVVSDEKVESTATITNGGSLDTESKLTEAKLKEGIIKGFFTLNDNEIQINPYLDSMDDILAKINNSIPQISAKYNVNLDRIEITPNDVSAIIKLGSWGDTSNFLGAINLIPTEIVNEDRFFDVDKDHWSFKYVNTLSMMDIVKGKDESFFGAKEYITNIESLKVVMESVKSKITRDNEYDFKLFGDDHWGYKYITAAIEEGIIEYDILYNPNRYINRGDMLIMMMKAKKIKTFKSLVPTFDDVSIESKYYYYLGSAQARGLIDGYKDNTFKPLNRIYRDEFTKIIYNVLSSK